MRMLSVANLPGILRFKILLLDLQCTYIVLTGDQEVVGLIPIDHKIFSTVIPSVPQI